MTTEIAILNRGAVALAADSAVTITIDGQLTKVYANANKLFELVKGAPVGLMIYNNADLAGIPWETLVKLFRRGFKGGTRDTLESYVDEFLEFVATRMSVELGDGHSKTELSNMVKYTSQMLLDAAAEYFTRLPSKVARKRTLLSMFNDLNERLEDSMVPWAEGLDEQSIWNDTRDLLTDTISETWCETKLSNSLRRRIARVSLAMLLHEPTLPTASWTGLVIAGFGDSQMRPSLRQLRISGVIYGRLVRSHEDQEIVSGEARAIIRPYAQTDDVRMFLTGIDPVITAGIKQFWKTWTGALHGSFLEMVSDNVGTVTDNELKELNTKVEAYFTESWSSFSDFMEEQYHQPRMAPIEASASFLSKGEIADLAETLVELTSLRNRVSIDRQETVGGATDVAVISHGDGFVWLKRKHYFERDRNPAWAVRQAIRDVVQLAGSQRLEEPNGVSGADLVS